MYGYQGSKAGVWRNWEIWIGMYTLLIYTKKWKSLSRVRLFATPLTIQSMEFSRPEYWRCQLFPPPGDLPNPGIEPRSPALQADPLPAEPQGKPIDIHYRWLIRSRCVTQGTLLSALRWPKWEENPKMSGYMCTYSWFTLQQKLIQRSKATIL